MERQEKQNSVNSQLPKNTTLITTPTLVKPVAAIIIPIICLKRNDITKLYYLLRYFSLNLKTPDDF